MPFDEALALEHRTHDQCLEMVAATGGVSDLDQRIRNSLPDKSFNFLHIHSWLFNRLPRRDSTPASLAPFRASQMLTELSSSPSLEPFGAAPFIRFLAVSLSSPGLPAPMTRCTRRPSGPMNRVVGIASTPR